MRGNINRSSTFKGNKFVKSEQKELFKTKPKMSKYVNSTKKQNNEIFHTFELKNHKSDNDVWATNR